MTCQHPFERQDVMYRDDGRPAGLRCLDCGHADTIEAREVRLDQERRNRNRQNGYWTIGIVLAVLILLLVVKMVTA